MSTGVLARGALIASIYKRGVFLAPSSRPSFPISTFVNHISTDISRLDDCAQWFRMLLHNPSLTLCFILNSNRCVLDCTRSSDGMPYYSSGSGNMLFFCIFISIHFLKLTARTLHPCGLLPLHYNNPHSTTRNGLSI